MRWDDLDAEKQTLRIDESLVATNQGAAWGHAKNERSRRTIPIDSETMRVFARRRAEQATESLVAGSEWEDNGLIIATRVGRVVLPTVAQQPSSSSRPPPSRELKWLPPAGGAMGGRRWP
jgi:hypothetical protein